MQSEYTINADRNLLCILPAFLENMLTVEPAPGGAVGPPGPGI